MSEFPGTIRVRSSRNRIIPIPLLCPAIKIKDCLKEMMVHIDGKKFFKLGEFKKLENYIALGKDARAVSSD